MGDLRPTYAEGSEEEEEIEEEDGTESDDDEVEDDTYEQPPPEPPRRHGKGPAKEKSHYKPHPKKRHKAPHINQSKPTERAPPKH
jgi:hypothetical protein